MIELPVKIPTRSLLAGAAVLTMLLAAAGPTMAADPPMNLSLRPAGGAGAFFDLSVQPGETRTFEVEIGNHGTAAVSVRTSATDVYTIINGGFGARLRGDPSAGTTTWLTYPTAVFTLAAGRSRVRPLSVSVPVDAAPGQYISSLIVENDLPITGDGAVQLDQIIRLAMTVRITIPGPLEPSLSIGSASHKVVVDNSVVAVMVANTGNEQLAPNVSFVLLDGTGSQVNRTSFKMGAFYAHTDTFIEIPLAALLRPGRYTVQLVLDDSIAGTRVSDDAIPLVIGTPALGSPSGPGAANLGPTSITHGSGDGPQVVLPILLAGLAGGLGIAVAFGLVVFVVRRRQPRV